MSSCLMFGKCNRGWSDAYCPVPDSSKTLSENIETIHGWLQIVWVLFLSLCLIGFMSLPQIIFHSVSPRFHPTNFDSTHSPNDSHRI